MSRALNVVAEIRKLESALDRPLVIVETGSIRNVGDNYIEGDGHSTSHIALFLSTSNYPHTFYSIDLDTRVAKAHIRALGLLQYVNFMEGNSLKMLQTIAPQIDVAYLDSANNAEYILQEFKIVESKRAHCVVIDDVNLESKQLLKGHRAVPYAREKGYKVTLLARQAVIWLL